MAIPRDMLRWVGYPGLPTIVIAPGQTKTSKNQRLGHQLAQPPHAVPGRCGSWPMP